MSRPRAESCHSSRCSRRTAAGCPPPNGLAAPACRRETDSARRLPGPGPALERPDDGAVGDQPGADLRAVQDALQQLEPAHEDLQDRRADEEEGSLAPPPRRKRLPRFVERRVTDALAAVVH